MAAMPQSSLPHSYPAHAQRHSPDSLSSPQADWRDTPRTLYKTSPETELGDNDLLSDCDAEEDGTSWNARDRSSPLFALSPHEEHSAEEPSSTDQRSSPAPDFQAFVSKLNADIRSKSSSLFSGITPEVMPWSFQSLSQKGPNGQPSGLTQVAAKAADVTATAAPPQPQTIPRKRSMHLNHPAQPINPYQRSATARSQPVNSYSAPVIDRAYLRRFRDAAVPPQRTVCMKELVLPHAEFRFGYDPEVQASELGSPTVHDFDALEEEGVSEDSLVIGGEDEQAVSPLVQDFVETEAVAEDDDAQGEADDSLFDPAGEDSYEPPAKRRRTEETRVSQPPVLRSRKPHAEVPKTRKRHLQPNLVRTNGCLYGCPLLFSTAYEARRHQEDTHGREEAYSFIKAASAAPRTPVYAKDYRFLIQITTHAMGDKLPSHVKKQLDEVLERDDETLDDKVVDLIANFARDWTKRYECPRCGASFSRLDSKKRHFEKQCR